MSTSEPTHPRRSAAPRSLRARWRSYMILGMTVLALAIAASASLIVLVEQRQMLIRVQQSAARETDTAVQQSVENTRQTLSYAAQTIDPAAVTASELERLMKTQPAIVTITVIRDTGAEAIRVPTVRAAIPPNWSQDPAFIAATAGKPYTGSIQGSPPSLVIAVPTGDTSGVLLAQIDPQILWQPILSLPVGDEGTRYVLDGSGLLLAAPSASVPSRTPAEFSSVRSALRGQPATFLYRGLDDQWVVGRAEMSAATGWIVVTETPLSEFIAPTVRVIALWVLALLVAFIVGEWLIRHILRTMLKPIHALHRGAYAVGTGDYSYRVRLPAGTDRELTDLGRTFNAMITRLQDSQRQIDAYTHEMQEIVDLRARELSRKALQLEVAAEVSGKIATILDPQALIKEVVDLIKGRFNIYYANIALVDSDTGQINPGKVSDTITLPRLTLGDETNSVVAWVARNGTTLYVPDITQESRYRRISDLPASQSELAIPLKFGAHIVGVLNLEADHRDAFPQDEIAVFESLANEIAVSMHNAQIFSALETANRDLAQATLQAKQANLLKARFLLNASHKLRTPLNVIIGYSETILSGIYGELPDTALDRQRRILENGRHLQALVEDILDLSAIETGHMALHLDWVDLPPLLDEVMNAARALHQTGYPEHDLALHLDAGADGALPPVWADLERLRYILINLLSNAVKFTEQGQITMYAEATADAILITVQDTGPGITDDDLQYLFEPFQHEHGSTASGGKGTGLGLPVARLLAQMHGGDLQVDTVLHQGSAFTLRLPRHPDDAPPPDAA